MKIFLLFLILGLACNIAIAAPLITVGGVVTDEKGQPVDNLKVIVRNPARNVEIEGKTGDVGPGRYSVLLFDFEKNNVAQVDDKLEITLKRDSQIVWTGSHIVTAEEINLTTVVMNIKITTGIPELRVTGTVTKEKAQGASVGTEVVVQLGKAQKRLTTDSAGRYAATFLQEETSIVTGSLVSAKALRDGWVIGYDQRALTQTDLDKAVVNIDLTVGTNRAPKITKMGSFQVFSGVPLSFDAEEGKLLQLGIIAEDPDNDVLTYQIKPVPEGARTEGSSLLFTPPYNAANAAEGSSLISFELLVSDGKLSDSSSIQVQVRNVSLAAKLEVKLSPDSLFANGTATAQITVHVSDSKGQPVSDEQIKLSADQGAVTSPMVNKSNGDYASSYTAGTKTGVVTLTAEASNRRSSQAKLTLVPGAPAEVQVALEKTYLPADGKAESQVSVTLLDGYGNRISGSLLTIRASQGSVTNLTDRGNGNYSATYTAGKTAGQVVISVKAPNGVEGKGELSLGADPGGFVEFSTISATSLVPADNVSQSKITVTILDKDKKPVSGKQIELQATGSRNILVQPASMTDARGQTSGYLASEVAEFKQITASIVPEGIQLTSTAMVEFRPGDAEKIEIRTDAQELVADGVSLIPFIVTIKDIFGNMLKWDDLPLVGAEQRLTIQVNNEKQSYKQNPAKGASVEFFMQAPSESGEQNIRVLTANGKVGSIKVKFSQPSLSKITEVSIEGSPASTGKKIMVVAVGTPANTVSFSFEGLARATNLPMVEQAPGHYVGQYTVIEGDNVTDRSVVVTLSGSRGTVTDRSQKVTIDTIPPPAPSNITIVGGRIDITNQSSVEVTGTSSPKRAVSVTMTGKIGTAATDIQPKQASITATDSGAWYASFDASRLDDGTVTVLAREGNDIAGNPGLSAQLTVIKNTKDRPFQIQVVAPPEAVAPGQSMTYRIYAIVGPSGYNQSVVFRKPDDLPKDVKYAYLPQDTVTPTADNPVPWVELKLTLPDNIQPGEYSFRVFVTSGKLFEEPSLSFSVKPPAVPITIEAAPREVLYDGKLSVQGTLELPESFSKPVQIKLIYVAPDGSEQEQTIETQISAKMHRYAAEISPADFKNIGEPIGLWRVTCIWEGKAPYSSASRGTDFVVNKGISKVEWQESPATVLSFEDAILQGALRHAQKPISGALIQIIARDSKGLVRYRAEVSTSTQGEFKWTFPKSDKGIWTITASWQGNRFYDSSIAERSLMVIQETGKAIIVLGGGNEDINEEWQTFSDVAQYVYHAMKRRHLTDEDIYFLSPTRKAQEGVDGVTTVERLEYAITNWAAQQVGPYIPLYIYLLSHNVGSEFLLEKDASRQKYLTPKMLDTWLDKLPEGTQVLLIIEACYSGNFIREKENGQPILPSPNRVIITSARDDVQAKIQRNLSSFTRFFFDEIQKPRDVRDAFGWATKVMERYPQHRAQFPLIEATGDSIVNQPADYSAVANFFIPDDTPSLGEPPVIQNVTPSFRLPQGKSSYTIRAQVQGPSIKLVRASIVPPDYDPYKVFKSWSESAPSVEVELKDPDGDGWYEGAYNSFIMPGEYKILIDAMNMDGYAPMPGEMSVIVPRSIPYDANGDGAVDIKDLIFAVERFGGTSWEADVNGDGMVNIMDLALIASALKK